MSLTAFANTSISTLSIRLPARAPQSFLSMPVKAETFMVSRTRSAVLPA